MAGMDSLNTMQREHEYLKDLLEQDSQLGGFPQYHGSLESHAKQVLDDDVSSILTDSTAFEQMYTDRSDLGSEVATTVYTVDPRGKRKKKKQGKGHQNNISFRKQELVQITDLMTSIPPEESSLNEFPETLAPVIDNRTAAQSGVGKALASPHNGSMGAGRDTGTSWSIDQIKSQALNFRMRTDRPELQIRLKLYLPHVEDDPDPQKLVLWVNKGASMGQCQDFLESCYPHNYLKGRIKQFCIADEDGDIDDDFPPIAQNQDLSALGIGHFYVDVTFGDKDEKLQKLESLPMQIFGNNKARASLEHRSRITEEEFDTPLLPDSPDAKLLPDPGKEKSKKRKSKSKAKKGNNTRGSVDHNIFEKAGKKTSYASYVQPYQFNSGYEDDQSGSAWSCVFSWCRSSKKDVKEDTPELSYQGPRLGDGNLVVPQRDDQIDDRHNSSGASYRQFTKV